MAEPQSKKEEYDRFVSLIDGFSCIKVTLIIIDAVDTTLPMKKIDCPLLWHSTTAVLDYI